MAFHQPEFLLFLVTVVLAFRWAPPGWRAWVLLGAGIAVYAWAGWRDMAVMGGVLTVNLVLWLTPLKRPVRIFWAASFSLLVLFAFKYAAFAFGAPELPGLAGAALPLGISFYVFQLIAWQVDSPPAKPGDSRAVARTVLFVTFFPHFVAGPIVRYRELMPRLTRLFQGRLPRPRLLVSALALILVGLLKKRFLADPLGNMVDPLFLAGPQSLTDAWIGAAAFAFQIYFDFSGYSDMAVGMALLFGLKLPRNFAAPYLTTNPRDFWRCWHITLSTWIRDYLYVPLGGARRGAWLVVVVMALAGLWHGANVTFIVWGALWGGYIALHRLVGARAAVPMPLAWVGHIAAVLALWVVFRAENLEASARYLAVMIGLDGTVAPLRPAADTALTVAGLALLFALQAVEKAALLPADPHRALLRLRAYNRPWVLAVLWGLIGFAYLMPQYTAENPFIYFRF